MYASAFGVATQIYIRLFVFPDYVCDTCVIRSLELNYNEPRTASIILI
jgi:hypothetical protein